MKHLVIYHGMLQEKKFTTILLEKILMDLTGMIMFIDLGHLKDNITWVQEEEMET